MELYDYLIKFYYQSDPPIRGPEPPEPTLEQRAAIGKLVIVGEPIRFPLREYVSRTSRRRR